jgi:beta-lactamase regulating signal transducer with metallopeptidase domain
MGHYADADFEIPIHEDLVEAGVPITSLAVLLWAVVAAGLLVRLGMALLRTRALEGELEDGTWTRAGVVVRRVARARGVGPVRVLLGPPDAMPATWGSGRPVLMLPSGAEWWPDARLEAVARHELAHVGRQDVRVQLLADILCALHWFNPLAWIAAHRLRVERELACDDEVLASGTRATDYATELLALARSLRDARVPVPAVAMARRTGLRTRLEAVLDEARPRGATGARTRLSIRACALVLLLFAGALTPATSSAAPETLAFHPRMTITIPTMSTAPADVSVNAAALVRGAMRALAQVGTLCWTDSRDGSSSIHHNDDRLMLSWKDGGCKVDVRVDGALTFNSDFTAITGISRGGRAVFEERAGERERRVELRPRDGGLEQRWFLDGAERTFDAEAQEWLAGMLLNTFRTGSLAAEERAAWMLRERGLDAVMAELPLLRGDHARGIYYQAVLSDPGLDAPRTARLMRDLETGVTSDHTKMTILQAVAERRSLGDAQVRTAYIAAAASIGSDHARARSLESALAQSSLSTDDLAAIIDAIAGIGSDHEKSQLLIQLAGNHQLTGPMRDAYLRVTASIGSDHAKGEAAQALLDAGEATGAEIALALDVARGIGSDHTRSELLRRLSTADLRNNALRERYEEAIAGIGSDHARGEVLLSLMEDRVDEVRAGIVLRGTGGIGSDHTRGEVLMRLIEAGGVTDATRAAFDQAVDRIGSDHTRGQVLRTLRSR